MTLEELRAQLASLHTDMGKIEDLATSEKRDLTPEETAELDGLQEKFEATKAEIEVAEKREVQARNREARTAYLDASRGRRTVADAVGAQVTNVHDRVEDDPAHGFAHAGEFYQTAWAAYTGGRGVDSRLLIGSAATGMNQAVGSEGAFLVPPTFSTTIWDGMGGEADNLLAQTDSFPVTGDSLTIPANAETSRATGSRFGGVQGYWIAEAEQITDSFPKLRQMKLEPKELAVLVYATDKLLRNGPAAEAYFTRAASEEIRFMTGDAIINGDGAGKPQGLLASASTIEVAKESGQKAATIVAENIIKMWARMQARARMGAVWYINQAIEPQLYTMTINVGTGGQPVFLPAGGLSGAPFATLFGRPIVPIEYCQALGTAGDIILTNLGFYATGVQGGIRSAASIHLRFDYAETAFRFMFAVDGQPWLASAITPFDAGDTLSAAVTIAVRA